jgi:hypothetical protein
MCAESALVRAVGVGQEGAAQEFRRAGHYAGQRRRLPACGGGERCGEDVPGGVRGAYRRYQDVDDSAAGQAHGERVLVVVAEAFEDRFPVRQRLLAQLVHRALHTAAGDRADRRAVGVHRQGGARLAGRAAADGHHGGHGEVASLLDPPVQLFGDVQHVSVS